MMPWGRASIREAGSGIIAFIDVLRSAGGTDDREQVERTAWKNVHDWVLALNRKGGTHE